MANVKIGDKTIAFPPGMSEAELEKAIRKLRIDAAAETVKDFKPPKLATAKPKKDGGMMKKNLKPVDKEKNPGLAKLPTEVRNKMGFMKDGGDVTNMPPSQRRIAEKLKNFIEKNGRTPSTDAEIDSVYGKGAVDKEMKRLGAKKMKDGGMVLEIGLRPATAKENKMAKQMMKKNPKKMAGGGMVARGTGAAIRGKGFKGVF